MSSSEVRVRSDLTGSDGTDKGDPDGDSSDSGEDVTIRYDAGTRSLELIPHPGSAQSVAHNISAFSIRYYNDAADAVTTSGAEVQRARIDHTGATATANPQTREVFSLELASDYSWRRAGKRRASADGQTCCYSETEGARYENRPCRYLSTGFFSRLRIGHSQSLGDLGKKERERRDKIKSESQPITNRDTPKYKGGAITTTSGSPSRLNSRKRRNPYPRGQPAGQCPVNPLISWDGRRVSGAGP